MPDSPDPIIPENRSIRVINTKNQIYPFQRKVVLSAEKQKFVREDLQKIYDGWNNGADLYRSQLKRWLINSESISEASDFPWRGASRLNKPIIETRINIVHSFLMNLIRTLMGRLFVCTTENFGDAAEKKTASDLTAYFNSNKEFNEMYVNSVSEAWWAILRDGTVGRSADWKKELERRWEVVTYSNLEEFNEKYPVASAAGMSDEEYLKLVARLENGEEVTVDEEFDFLTIDRPHIETEEIKDVVIYPLTVSDQKRARFLGKRVWLRKSELLQREKDGIYHNVKDVISKAPSTEPDSVTQMQNSIVGISEPEQKEDYELIHGVYKGDLDGDGIEEKYLVTYAVDSKIEIQFDKYPFYHNEDFIKISWFKRRPKRIIGRGVAEMLEDLYVEANIQTRHRINSRAITDSPQLEADETMKDRIDPIRPENRIRPGGVWWLPANQLGKVKPIEIPKKDFGDSIREEALINQAADNLLGASELRSGRETVFDPRAPAAKTALLLNQSTVRLDDFVFGFIMKENEVLDMALRLYYQYGPDKLKFFMPEGDAVLAKEIEKSKLRSNNLHLQLSVTSLVDNPNFLRQKWEEFYARYGQEPMMGAIPEIRHEMLNQIVLNTPEAKGVRILFPLQETLQKISAQVPPMPAGTKGGGGKPPGNGQLPAPNALAQLAGGSQQGGI